MRCELLDAFDRSDRIGHLDLKTNNLLVTPSVDGVPGKLYAIDFFDAGLCDPRLDLAVCAAYWGSDGGRDAAWSFVDGYAGSDTGERGKVAADVGVSHIRAAGKLLWLRAVAFGSPRAGRLADLDEALAA